MSYIMTQVVQIYTIFLFQGQDLLKDILMNYISIFLRRQLRTGRRVAIMAAPTQKIDT